MSDAEPAPSVPAAAQVADAPRSSSKGPTMLSPRLDPPQRDRERERDSARGSPRKVDGDDRVELSSPKADSEAETIIQSGRESLSPEKKRKFIQPDQKRTHAAQDPVDSMEVDAPPTDTHQRKRKRMENDTRDGDDDASRRSGTQSRAASPSRPVVKTERTEEPHGVSDRIDRRHSSHVSLTSRAEKDRRARKRSSSEGVGEGDSESDRRVRPQRSVEPARNGERKSSNPASSSTRRVSDDRSVSPPYRVHKRGASGPQLSSVEHRKKRAPPPLMTGRQRHSSEDRQSVSSSTSGSPLPSSHLRRLQSADTAATSPAKQMAHKKQRDQNGRTRLARACAAQEVEAAKARHAERPEDLNVADNAGNTPLQIASLEGCAPIVKFLLDAGCEVDTKNIDKDTPLIDAVENGHLEVVKLLLAAGANPRMVNAEGDEPYELVPSDSEDYEEIRRVIAEAKANPHRRQRSDDGANGYKETSRGVSAASPRDSPPVNGRSPPPMLHMSKRRTVRSEATRNDLLWTKATPENLREFAAKGDMAGVANILNVGQKADAESLIAAAKGGHDEVMQLLLGIGFANPDPDPVHNGYLKPGFNTPMLAAIGRGNLAVIRLLLAQPGFNPARRLFRDRYYFELARERRGDNWQEEYDILKHAYDDYIQARRMRKPDVRSPRRARDMEREKESKRAARRASPSPVSSQRKAARSPPPNRHQESSAKEIRREKKRDGAGVPRERSPHGGVRSKVSARDGSHSEHSVPPSEADSRSDSNRAKSAVSGRSHGDAHDEAPKRRRLIAGRPPQDRERKKSSMLPDTGREETSRPRPSHTASETTAEKPGAQSLKRSRSSDTSERSRSRDREAGRDLDELQKKKRRVSEGPQKEKVNGTKRRGDSPAELHSRNSDNHAPDSARTKAPADNTPTKDSAAARPSDSAPSVKEEKKREPQGLEDIPMEVDKRADAEAEAKKAEAEAEQRRIKEEARKAEEERIAEEKRLAAEAEKARIAKEEEEAKEAAEKAARLAREKAEEEERKRKEAEQRRIRQAEDERQKRLEQERLRVAKLRKEQEEQEQRRRDALPNRLRMAANLVGSNDPRAKSHAWLKQFMPVVTAKTRQIDPSCEQEVAEERWVPNFLVAPLLATNDLQLSQYTSWEKRNATPTQRMNLWRVTRRILVQADDSDFLNLSFGQIMQKDCETRPKYFDMEHVFWVRLSDFMDLVPHIPHLHGLDIQLLKMHVDSEPTLGAPLTEPPQTNGHVFGIPHSETATDAHANGLTNGYGPTRPSTYV
ncbi:hypothetical protein Plec18170_007218 [Paecilomyces lecythidis]